MTLEDFMTALVTLGGAVIYEESNHSFNITEIEAPNKYFRVKILQLSDRGIVIEIKKRGEMVFSLTVDNESRVGNFSWIFNALGNTQLD